MDELKRKQVERWLRIYRGEEELPDDYDLYSGDIAKSWLRIEAENAWQREENANLRHEIEAAKMGWIRYV